VGAGGEQVGCVRMRVCVEGERMEEVGAWGRRRDVGGTHFGGLLCKLLQQRLVIPHLGVIQRRSLLETRLNRAALQTKQSTSPKPHRR
jgi:hypothetical protein